MRGCVGCGPYGSPAANLIRDATKATLVALIRYKCSTLQINKRIKSYQHLYNN